LEFLEEKQVRQLERDVVVWLDVSLFSARVCVELEIHTCCDLVLHVLEIVCCDRLSTSSKSDCEFDLDPFHKWIDPD